MCCVQQGSQACTAFPLVLHCPVLIDRKDLCYGMQDQGRDPELKQSWALVLSRGQDYPFLPQMSLLQSNPPPAHSL